MIRLVIFDLDGTLVQTERLKAISYARAAVQLCPDELDESEAIDLYQELVGRSRREVSETFVDRFNLGVKALALYQNPRNLQPWQAFVQVRLKIYEEMTSDPGVLRDNRWAHNIELLSMVKEKNYKTALATMSGRTAADRVLRALELTDAFDFIATRDDVDKGKPDPEIYLLVSDCLNVPPGSCLVVEDSPAGVEAVLQAGMCVMAVPTPITRKAIYESSLLDQEQIVDDPLQVTEVFNRLRQRC